MIENYLTEHGGLGAFCALILLKVGEMIWNYFKNRERVTDDTLKKLVFELQQTNLALNSMQADVKKLKLDLRRAFYALKRLSGKDWPSVAEELRGIKE